MVSQAAQARILNHMGGLIDLSFGAFRFKAWAFLGLFESLWWNLEFRVLPKNLEFRVLPEPQSVISTLTHAPGRQSSTQFRHAWRAPNQYTTKNHSKTLNHPKSTHRALFATQWDMLPHSPQVEDQSALTTHGDVAPCFTGWQ